MATIEPTLPPPDDVTAVKATLAVLLVAWLALAGWTLVNAERLSAPLAPLLSRIASATPSSGTAGTAPTVPEPGATRPVPEAVRGGRASSPDGQASLPESADPAMVPGVPETTGRVERVERIERAESAGPIERAELVDGPSPVVIDGPPAESLFEVRRAERLEMLSELGSKLQFSSGSDALESDLREPLEQLFEILFLYPDAAVDIAIESNEHPDAANDLLLSRARAQAIVDYLVSRGLERGRFALDIGVGDGLPSGEHRVRVRAEDDFR